MLEASGYKNRDSLSAALVTLAKKNCLEKTGKRGISNLYRIKSGESLPPLKLTQAEKEFFDKIIENTKTDDGDFHFRITTVFDHWGIEKDEEREKLMSFFEKMIDQKIIIKVADDIESNGHRLPNIYRLYGDGTNFLTAIGRATVVSEEEATETEKPPIAKNKSGGGVKKILTRIGQIDERIAKLKKEKEELKVLHETFSEIKRKLSKEQLSELKKML